MTGRAGLAVVVMILVLGTSGEVSAQNAPGPYSNYNWNSYNGLPYYNPGYAQYGLPGIGVSPWDPIVQAQRNLGSKTARKATFRLDSLIGNDVHGDCRLWARRATPGYTGKRR